MRTQQDTLDAILAAVKLRKPNFCCDDAFNDGRPGTDFGSMMCWRVTVGWGTGPTYLFIYAADNAFERFRCAARTENGTLFDRDCSFEEMLASIEKFFNAVGAPTPHRTGSGWPRR